LFPEKSKKTIQDFPGGIRTHCIKECRVRTGQSVYRKRLASTWEAK